MEHRIVLKKIEYVTHNVLHLIAEKPKGYGFSPGQATEVSIDKEGFRAKKRPFTFTSLPGDEDLEFTIKVYPSHDGVTKELHQLKVGDHLLIGDAWGAIQYKGPGVFIAGGAGVTPFIAILKDLHRKGKLGGHRLFFANQKEKDIICRNKLRTWLGDEVVHILSKEDNGNFPHGHINRAFLEEHHLDNSGYVYLCGPPPMMDALPIELYALGVPKDHLITEDPE
ncbi:flavodoxin reductase [Arenibacter sp. 6A1]|uniref:flavodoxin reductase n=1 Tax=Arenibacter sp. 6A1 TaxID=2720391 RepID=UPI0014477A54|nr:flavodoxin reductase [Arenibacter sp. 6A1]NKI27649.1 flavodoxin reductase [Arenibacter sp. 6A1]